MRLFKKRKFVPAEPDVSASDSSHQDEFAVPKRPRREPLVKQRSLSASSFTKGLSSLGRKVGEKWEQLKRSSSADLDEPTGQTVQLRRSASDATDIFSKSKPKKRMKSLQSMIKSFSWTSTSHSEKPVYQCETPEQRCSSADLDEATEPKVQLRRCASDAKIKSKKRMKSLQNMIKSFSWTSTCHSQKPNYRCDTNEWMMREGKFVRFEAPSDVNEGATGKPKLTYEELQRKKLLLAQAIEGFENKNQKLESYLSSPGFIETPEGSSEVRNTLAEIDAALMISRRLYGANSLCVYRGRNLSLDSNEFQAAVSIEKSPVVKKSKHEKCEAAVTTKVSSEIADLEDLMKGLRISGGESGYDTDSARISQSSLSKPGDLAEYEGVDLSFYEIPQPEDEPLSKPPTIEVYTSRDASDVEEPPTRPPTIVVEVEVHASQNAKDEDLDDTLPVSDDEEEHQPIILFEKSKSESELLKVDPPQNSCKIIGALTKDGRAITALDMSLEKKSQRLRGLSESTLCNFDSSNIHTIVLEKGIGKMGFTLAGGAESSKVLHVKSIRSGSQADQKGLEVKDVILAINGVPVGDMIHSEAVQLFHKVKSGKFVVHVERWSNQTKLHPSS